MKVGNVLMWKGSQRLLTYNYRSPEGCGRERTQKWTSLIINQAGTNNFLEVPGS